MLGAASATPPFESTVMAIPHDDRVLREHEVRLFPTSHIKREREAELRATASLLASVSAVSEFGRSFVRAAGGPAGYLRAYTELSFDLEEGQRRKPIRPDGVLIATRGSKEWAALVEVKVGGNPLEQAQFDDYHRLASQAGFDAIITISNQPALAGDLPPLNIDRRRLRRVSVTHFSWERLLSEARLLCRKSGIADSDQEWMLNEWIRYVADEGSRIIEQPDLGAHWHEVLDASRQGRLDSMKPQLEDVVSHWDGFLRKSALRLRAELGVEVQRRESRSDRKDPASRVTRLTTAALSSGQLSGELRVPDAAGDLQVGIHLQARAARFAIDVDAPAKGRARTRINWLARQLKKLPDAPRDLTVRARWDQRGLESWTTLAELLEDQASILRDPNGLAIPKSALPRRFTLERMTELRKGRGRSSARTLEGLYGGLESFYETVVQGLVRYQPPAPKIEKDEGSTAALPSSPLSEAERLEGEAPIEESAVPNASEPSTIALPVTPHGDVARGDEEA